MREEGWGREGEGVGIGKGEKLEGRLRELLVDCEVVLLNLLLALPLSNELIGCTRV